jgi:hypothetical protein
MRKAQKKLALNRDTVLNLDGAVLQGANGGSLLTYNCPTLLCSVSCITCANCPTRVQNCTNLC